MVATTLMLALALTILYSPTILAGTVFNMTRTTHKHPSTVLHRIQARQQGRRALEEYGWTEGFSLGSTTITPVDSGILSDHVSSQADSGDGDAMKAVNPGVVLLGSILAVGTNNMVDEATLDLTSSTSHGVTYTVEVEVQGTLFNVVADTGSSEFWVPAQTCATCASAGMQSSTIQLAEPCTQQNQTYGLGWAAGCLVDVDVKFGGVDLSDYRMMGVNEIDSAFARQAKFLSGILGFGKDEGTVDGGPTLLSALYSKKQISSPTVGFYLSRDEASGGQLFLGDAEASSYAIGESVKLAYQENDFGYYQVQMDSMDAGTIRLASSTGVIIDTGSTSLIVPRSVAPQIAVALLGTEGVYYTMNGAYILPCNNTAGQTAAVTVSFGGKEFHMKYEDFIGPELASGWCGAYLSSVTSDVWVLGEAFLHNAYSTYNTQSGEVTLYALSA